MGGLGGIPLAGRNQIAPEKLQGAAQVALGVVHRNFGLDHVGPVGLHIGLGRGNIRLRVQDRRPGVLQLGFGLGGLGLEDRRVDLGD
jgi:hypothetical protein